MAAALGQGGMSSRSAAWDMHRDMHRDMQLLRASLSSSCASGYCGGPRRQ